MSASSSPPGSGPGFRRTLVLGILGGGLCALFLGLMGNEPARQPEKSGPKGGQPVPPVRLQGIEAVRMLARTVRGVRLNTKSEETAYAMAKLGMDKILPEDLAGRRALLIEALGDPKPDVQWVGMSGLFRYEAVDGRLVKILLVRALDENELVRRAAVQALRLIRLTTVDGYRLLYGALASSTGPVWAAVMHALINAKADSGLKSRLIEALQKEHLEVRRTGAYGLAHLNLSPETEVFPHGDARDALIAGLRDPDGEVRMWCAQALSRMYHEAAPAIEPLVTLLLDPERHVADWAMAALGEIGPDVLPAMGRLIVKGDRGRAAGAAYVLKRIGGDKAIAILEKGILHTDPVIRVRSMMALKDIDPQTPGSLALYGAALKSGLQEPEDVEVLRLTLEGLLRLGADAGSLRAQVVPLAKHADPMVSAEAKSILAATAQ